MGFWDDINKILGGGFKSNSIGGDNYLSGSSGDTAKVSPDSRGYGPLQAPPDHPFKRSVDEIQSIQQISNQPFNVFDITPYFLAKDQYPCIYKRDVLTQLVGPEENSEYDFAIGPPLTTGGGNSGDGGAPPYWRTVQLPLIGNFLKIDFLPTRIYNEFTGLTPQVQGGVDASQSQYGGTLYNNDYYWNTTGTVGPPYKVNYPNADLLTQTQSKNLILVSFDAQQSTPLVVKNGDVIKCPYNVVYLTIKTGMPRIRITSGYNAEIVDAGTDRSANQNLALGPGYGFLDKPTTHFEPFCVTQGDNITTGVYASMGTATSLDLIIVNSAQNLANTVNAVNANPLQRGVGLLWITDLQLFLTTGNANANIIFNFTLYISDTSGNLRRIVHRFSPVSFRVVTGESAHLDVTKSFPTPIRVSLHQDEQLRLGLYNGSENTMSLSYSINGYTYGRWRFDANNTGVSGNQVPILLMDLLLEHPYFLDNFRTLGGSQSPNAVVK